MKNKIIIFMVVTFLGLLITSCAMLEEEEAKRTEQLLIASGFMIQQANTPEQIAQLEAQPQRQLIVHYKDGAPRYVYANSYENCMYVGDQTANQKYQALLVQQEITARQQATAEANQNAAYANENAANMNRDSAAMKLQTEREKRRHQKHKHPKMNWDVWNPGPQMQP